MLDRVITAAAAAVLIEDEDFVIIGGSAGMGVAESVLIALAERFDATTAPQGLTIMHTTGVGAVRDRGLNHIARRGLVNRVIGGNFGLQLPFMKELITSNAAAAYNLPQGVICQLYRAMAARQPGVVTHVGLGTYMDPRQEGGRMNDAAREPLVELVELGGREWLFYKTPRPTVALLRGTTADEDGNVSLEHEPTTLEGLSIAEAVRNNGGIVICQVERLARRGALHPQMVRIPGFLIDYFVHDPGQWQNYAQRFDPSLCGEAPRPLATLAPEPLSERRVIQRRAALEMTPGAVINLGVGVSAGIAAVLAEEGIEGIATLTVEAGVVGGVPGQALYFGSAYNPQAIIDQPYMFDFYSGGGLDIAFVSFAEADAEGNINVTRFGDRNDGSGGFIEITQNSKRIVFSGTLTGGGLKTRVGDGRLAIEAEGGVRKLVPKVNQISYNGRLGLERGQETLLVSERAVLRMAPRGWTVVELAPGVRLREDVLAQAGFDLHVAADLKAMDWRIFREGPMGIAAELRARAPLRQPRRRGGAA